MDFAPDPRPGRLRRRIALSAESSERATGWVEDDFHHFGVMIEHRAGVVTRVTAVAPRAPWSTCPAAVLPLPSTRSSKRDCGAAEQCRVVSRVMV
jgi:hypothetical protein